MRFASLALLALASVASAAYEPAPHLRPRLKAPAWEANAVVDQKVVAAKSSDYLGKWLVLFFYPFDFTWVCPTEISAFSDSVAQFEEIGAKVVGVSTDSHHTHLAWARTPRTEGGLGPVKIPLVADISKEISRKYGVLVDDPSDGMFGAALRGLFVIDPKGVIRSIQINDDHVGRSVEETLRIVKGFQYADTHGEVCPSGWKKPGDATIAPGFANSRAFFAKWGEGK